jgi:hypothetical protein
MALKPSPAFGRDSAAPTRRRRGLEGLPVVRFQGSVDIELRAREHVRHSPGQDYDFG